MRVKKEISKYTWIYICDKCKENKSIGKCLLCGEDVCNVCGKQYDVSDPPISYGMALTYTGKYKYIFLCSECQKTNMTLDEFITKFGCNKGNIKDIRLTPV